MFSAETFKGKAWGFFSAEVVHQGCLFETCMNSGGMNPQMFLIPEDLHLLRYGKNNHMKMQVVKNGGEPTCHGPKPLG